MDEHEKRGDVRMFGAALVVSAGATRLGAQLGFTTAFLPQSN